MDALPGRFVQRLGAQRDAVALPDVGIDGNVRPQLPFQCGDLAALALQQSGARHFHAGVQMLHAHKVRSGGIRHSQRDLRRKRDRPERGIALWRANHDPRAFSGPAEPLHRSRNADSLLTKVDAAPAQRAELADAQAGIQRQEQAEFAAVRGVQQICNEPFLLLNGQHAHLPALALRITDLERQSVSRPPCLRILQNTVQDRQDVMHGLDRQPVRFKQFPREGIDRRGADAAQSAAGVICRSRIARYLM